MRLCAQSPDEHRGELNCDGEKADCDQAKFFEDKDGQSRCRDDAGDLDHGAHGAESTSALLDRRSRGTIRRMSEPPNMSRRRGSRRPLRYWGIPVRSEGDQDHPSVWGTALLSVIALIVTIVAVGVISHPNPDNIPGDFIEGIVFASLALWVDWSVLRRWEKIVVARRGPGSN